jgi:hypothetical protein
MVKRRTLFTNLSGHDTQKRFKFGGVHRNFWLSSFITIEGAFNRSGNRLAERANLPRHRRFSKRAGLLKARKQLPLKKLVKQDRVIAEALTG